MEDKTYRGRGVLVFFLLIGFLFFIATTLPLYSEGSKEAVELQLWGGYPEMEPYYELVIEDFEKNNPNVKIKQTSYKLRDFEQKLNLNIATGTGPDLFQGHNWIVQPLIEKGYIEANSQQVDEYLQSGEFIDYILNENTYQGNTYGLPVFFSAAVMLWNKKMFEAEGLASAPTTLDEMLSYSRKLAKYDSTGNLIRSGISLRLSGGGSGVATKWWNLLVPAGGDLFQETKDGKYKNGYDNEAGRETLKLYIDIVHKHNVDNLKIKHDAEAFALEKTAMFIREPWVIGYMKKHAPNVEYDTSFFPKDKRWETVLFWSSLYVPKKTKHKEEAWDFIMSLKSKPEYDEFLFRNVGWLPPKMGLAEKYRELIEEIPQYKNCVTFPDGYGAYATPIIPATDEVLTKLAERLMAAFQRSDLVDNPEGISEVIKEAAKETDKILKASGYYGTD